VLPDSSEVTLNALSHISYASDIQNANDREVWLEGEAFFNVKHIETNEKPTRFIVHSGDMNIEVLGTTFNVKKFGTVTNVSLNTGKIKIALKDDPNTTINLQPGDFISYSAKEKRILKKQVKAELYSVWKEEKIELDNMPLSEIAGMLQDAYGYTIEISNKKLANSKVSGTLHLKDEATLLETLAFTLDIDIVKKENLLSLKLKN
jgi:ferric-dicitrate binding protein FerR (iron transport regulator)